MSSARRLLPPMVFMAVFVAFAPTLWNGFINYDDPVNFLENTGYRGLGPANLKWMFTSTLMAHWHPVTWLTLGLDYVLWGMRPAGYHLTSLIFHAASAALLWGILARLLGRAAPLADERVRLCAATFGALLWGLHPLRVESVAWITERRDVVCGLFVMLAVLAYLRMAEERARDGPWSRWMAASCAAFALSLMSKTLSIMLPLALLVLDWVPLRRFAAGRTRALLLEKLPFVLVAVGGAAAVLISMSEYKAVRPVSGYVPAERAAQAAYGLCFYIWKSLLPFGLSPVYPLEGAIDFLSAPYVASFAAVGVGTIVLYAVRRLWPEGLATWVAYAVLVAPVLGLVVTGHQLVADRYSYLSSIPFSILAAGAAVKLGQGGRLPRGLSAVAGVFILAALGFLTFVQTRVWRDSFTLWDHAISGGYRGKMAHQQRGVAHSEAGRLREAVADYDAAILIDPTFFSSQLSRAKDLHALGEHREALKSADVAIRLSPAYAEAYLDRGDIRLSLGDVPGALKDYGEAVRCFPGFAKAYAHRGSLKQAQGDVTGAFADYAAALQANPDHVRTLLLRGRLLEVRGDTPEAMRDFDRAVNADPGRGDVWQERGTARMRAGDLRGAIQDLTEAIRRDPALPDAFMRRGAALVSTGLSDAGIADFREAIRLAPELPDGYANIGLALAARGEPAGAILQFEEARKRAPEGWPSLKTVEEALAKLRLGAPPKKSP